MSKDSQTPLGVTYGSLGVLGPSAVAEVAQAAVAAGYRSFWTVEATGTDAITLLGAVSQAAPELDLARNELYGWGWAFLLPVYSDSTESKHQTAQLR